MSDDFVSVLDECLSDVLDDQATVESCLDGHPELAGELEPLLRVAEGLHRAPWPALPEEVKDRIGARLGVSLALDSNRGTVHLHRPRFRLTWRLVLIGAGALALIVTLALVWATSAGGSSPFDTSPRPIARATAPGPATRPSPSQNEHEAALATARQQLWHVRDESARGRIDVYDVDALVAATQHLVELAETLPADLSRPLLGDLLALLDEEKSLLTELLVGAPVTAKAALQNALDAIEVQAGRAEALSVALGADLPGGMPAVAPSTTPASPATTPSPSLTSSPSPTPTAVIPPPSGETARPEELGPTTLPEPPGSKEKPVPPGQTKTPEPPGLTKTPEPPGQNENPDPPGRSKPPEGSGGARTPGPEKPPKKP